MLSETVRRFLPLALRLAKTLRPLAVDILSLKPCLLRRFLFDGWYVLFIPVRFYKMLTNSDCKGIYFMFLNKRGKGKMKN
jgi:hypothetical protein